MTLAGAGTSLRRIAAAIVLLGSAVQFAQAGEDEPRPRPDPPRPIGRWLTEDGGGVIEIDACGASLCGRIVGMSEPVGPDGKLKTDNQGRPKCGLTILHQAVPTQAGQWAGHITNPDDGSDWNCLLSVDAEGRLHLRGYVLVPVLGQTQIWTPYSGRLGPECKIG